MSALPNNVLKLKDKKNELLLSTQSICFQLFNDDFSRINFMDKLHKVITQCYKYRMLECILTSYKFNPKKYYNDTALDCTCSDLDGYVSDVTTPYHYINKGYALAKSINIFDWYTLKSEVSYFLDQLSKPGISADDLNEIINAFNISRLKDYTLDDALSVETVNRIYNRTLSSLKRMDYNDYIKTDHWKSFSEKALAYYGEQCMDCGKNVDLVVHHKNYHCFGEETFEDVSILCKGCQNKRL
jgi:5-methylcytosine-specific restriction endonuclease McrA